MDDVKIKVALGYTDFDENPGKLVKVESYKLHGAFKYPQKDFALIKLAEPVAMDDAVQPACFPNRDTYASNG